jgi:hypothetical protein
MLYSPKQRVLQRATMQVKHIKLVYFFTYVLNKRYISSMLQLSFFNLVEHQPFYSFSVHPVHSWTHYQQSVCGRSVSAVDVQASYSLSALSFSSSTSAASIIF